MWSACGLGYLALGMEEVEWEAHEQGSRGGGGLGVLTFRLLTRPVLSELVPVQIPGSVPRAPSN